MITSGVKAFAMVMELVPTAAKAEFALAIACETTGGTCPLAVILAMPLVTDVACEDGVTVAGITVVGAATLSEVVGIFRFRRSLNRYSMAGSSLGGVQLCRHKAKKRLPTNQILFRVIVFMQAFIWTVEKA
jgi:hypothetical protein